MRLHNVVVAATSALFVVLVACGKMDTADASPDAADAFDPTQGCAWPNKEGGTIHCPADGKTSCPSGYDCNTCRCNIDGTRGCTTLICH